MNPGEGEALLSYRPSVFYFRRALRETEDQNELREIGLLLCKAYEMEKEWIRSQGLTPPKTIALNEEAEAKGWILAPDDCPAQITHCSLSDQDSVRSS